MRALLFLSADEVSPGPQCSEMENMPFPVSFDAEWLLEVVSCSLAIDSMTWDFTTKALTRAGFLCADREMCLPLVFTLIQQLYWTDMFTSPKFHLLNPDIPFWQPCLFIMPCQTSVWFPSKPSTLSVLIYVCHLNITKGYLLNSLPFVNWLTWISVLP